MRTSSEHEGITLLQFAELLEHYARGAGWARELYWTAVEADRGDRTAVETILRALVDNTENAMRLRELAEAIEGGDFQDHEGNRHFRQGQAQMESRILDYISTN